MISFRIRPSLPATRDCNSQHLVTVTVGAVSKIEILLETEPFATYHFTEVLRTFDVSSFTCDDTAKGIKPLNIAL
jgi:hypothetical protein